MSSSIRGTSRATLLRSPAIGASGETDAPWAWNTAATPHSWFSSPMRLDGPSELEPRAGRGTRRGGDIDAVAMTHFNLGRGQNTIIMSTRPLDNLQALGHGPRRLTIFT